MAKKKTENPEVPATQESLRAVRLYLPTDEHKKLRRVAADNDTNMALMARRIVVEYLASHLPKGNSK